MLLFCQTAMVLLKTSHIQTIVVPFVVNNISVLARSTIGTCVFGLIIGVLLGLLCRIKRIRTNSTIPVIPSQSPNTSQPSSIPVYEDVDLVKIKMDKIELSHNIAYANVQNIVST